MHRKRAIVINTFITSSNIGLNRYTVIIECDKDISRLHYSALFMVINSFPAFSQINTYYSPVRLRWSVIWDKKNLSKKRYVMIEQPNIRCQYFIFPFFTY